MNSPDLKKLVAGFLVLSAIASVVTLISLNFIGKGSPAEQAIQIEGDGGNNPLSTIGKNAFVEKLPESGSRTLAQSSGDGAVAASSNLTQNLAGVFAAQMVENNPSGPQSDQSGNPTVLNLPGEDKAADMVKNAISKTNIAFDDRISVAANKIKKSFTPADVSEYLKQVNELLGQVSSSTKSSLIAAQQNQNPEALVFPALALESAVAKLSSFSVPQPLVGLHTALLRFFSNQKNVFGAVADYQTDPMKTLIALQNENEIIKRDLALIKNAASKVNQKALSSNNSPEWEKLYSGIFGVQKAYAQWAVFDAFNFAEAVATVGTLISNNLARITEWLYTTALRIAVNVLINEFQNQVVNWIAGNGDPKFITDWKGFLGDAANKAAGQVINSINPAFCSGIGPLLRVSLLPVPRANTGVSCTFNQVVNNVNNFFNRFQNGGWYYYSQLAQPNGNYYGQLITLNDQVLIKTAEAQQAAKTQATADKGFLSVTKCTQYQTDELGNELPGLCVPGKEVITTPGAVVGETLTTSLGWKGNQIVSAQRFEDLVAAIVNASINRVMKEGLSALSKTMTDTLDRQNPPNAASTPGNSGISPGLGNPGSSSGSLRDLNSLVVSMSQTGVFNDNQAIIDSNTFWLAVKPDVIAGLSQLSSSCSRLTEDANQRIDELNSFEASVRAELHNADIIQDARFAAGSATLTQDIMDIIGVLQGIDIIAIRDISATAQTRASAIQNIQRAIDRISSSGDCVGFIPSATDPTSGQSSGSDG